MTARNPSRNNGRKPRLGPLGRVQRQVTRFIRACQAFLNGRRVQITQLAAFHRLPAAYALRDYVEAGGLISYGSNIVDGFRQVGLYVGRILKGAQPADLPVVHSNKFELVINAQTARMLGLTVPPSLLARADEVIE
jgi:ABC-type uncharacterized transport system substrate-binding protein